MFIYIVFLIISKLMKNQWVLCLDKLLFHNPLIKNNE